jgi:flagellar biosynthesis/type III secretory pathway protein FliH
LEETSANEKTRLIYEARLKAARDKMAEIDYAQDKGFNKGIRRGKKEGRVEGREEVFALIERGISLTEAKRMLGIA